MPLAPLPGIYRKKKKPLLFTTDLAAHIGDVLETKVNYEHVNIEGGLRDTNIEQKQAMEKYRQKILDDERANNYSDELLASLEEELKSICTEEIVILEQYAQQGCRGPGLQMSLEENISTGNKMLTINNIYFFVEEQAETMLDGVTIDYDPQDFRLQGLENSGGCC